MNLDVLSDDTTDYIEALQFYLEKTKRDKSEQQEENDKKEIAYMKQVHELEKEVERLENIEQELTDLKNHYKSKIL